MIFQEMAESFTTIAMGFHTIAAAMHNGVMMMEEARQLKTMAAIIIKYVVIT